MDNNAVEKIDTFWRLFLGMLAGIILTVLLSLTAHGEQPSGRRHDNSLGVVIEYTNPFMYNFGKIVDASIVRTKNRTATNLRFQPYGTFELYTEQVLLCGLPSQDLINKAGGPIVLTYRRQAHEAVDGVACHDLESVFSVGKQD